MTMASDSNKSHLRVSQNPKTRNVNLKEQKDLQVRDKTFAFILIKIFTQEYISILEIENPNRVKPKQKKVTAINTDDGKPQLSRREREELEKQKAKAHYQKLHAAGKTEEARADLARLAIIRKQREEAAKKREEEKKGKFL